jgi:hypothetical protein
MAAADVEVDMEEQEQASQPPAQQQNGAENSSSTNNSKRKPRNQNKPPEFPCLCCGENCNKNQQSVRCIMCQLWAHRDCLKMPDNTFKHLDEQAKEGTAFWVCRPCQSFGQRVQHQFAENNKRHDTTEKRVEANSRRIAETEKEMDKLKEALRKMEEKIGKDQGEREDNLCDEMQEREVRRMNLIIHGVDEPNDVRGNREKIEKDKERCEKIFTAMKARTRKEDIRFCRRIGERGDDPRPMVIGLENEEEKRHLLGRARELRNTKYSDISIVPDLTRKQRNREARMKDEAEEKNKELTEEEKSKNIKWMVVGRRGEKRIIKGVERDQQPYIRDVRRDEQSQSNTQRNEQTQRRTERNNSRQGEEQEQRRGGLLPPVQREPWRPETREGRWYRKEPEERDLGARSKTSRQPENRGAGAPDQQARGASGRWDGNGTGRDSRHSKRSRWSGTSSEEDDHPRSRPRH